MVKNLKITLLRRLILLTLIFLMGCNQSTILESTINPTITSSPTLNPTIAVIQIPTANATTLATLSPEATQLEIARLMETNNNCSELCFWGIIPGVTSFDQAVGFLRTLSDTTFELKRDGLKEYNNVFLNGEDNQISIIFSELSGKVKDLDVTVYGLDNLAVSAEKWKAFRPDNFMRTNGVPKKINIIMSEGPEGRLSYSMILFYDKGYISFDGNQVVIKENILHACPLAKNNISRFDIKSITENVESLNEPGGFELKKISGITAEGFFQILTGNPLQACFDLDYNVYKSLY